MNYEESQPQYSAERLAGIFNVEVMTKKIPPAYIDDVRDEIWEERLRELGYDLHAKFEEVKVEEQTEGKIEKQNTEQEKMK